MTQLFKLNNNRVFSIFFLYNKKIPLFLPLLINNKFVTDIKRKANIFNNFFAKQCTPLKTIVFLQQVNMS